VGDDSQSIYSWRGAHFQNIINFPARYEKAAVYKIEINYRSTPEILKVANMAIAANAKQFAKHLTAARRSGSKPLLVPCATSGVQAMFVAQRILELREEGRELNKMAVLYRSHFHALELQLELTRRNIPFTITSGIRFFEQAHIKDVAAYVKFITNPRDELALKRIVRLMKGVGGKTADRIWNTFQGAPGPPLAVALQKISSVLPRKAAVDWAQFTATISQLEHPEIRRSPARVIQLVLEAGYDEYLKETYANYRTRREDIEQLAGFSRQFNSVEEFLTQLALQTSIEAEDAMPGPRDEEAVRLSTIHQAKGLEFDVVFIIMLCDGLFPSARSLEFPENIEEERRLFYVAITRARDELHLSYPLYRPIGAGGESMQHPSRFLGELPPELLEEVNLRGHFAGEFSSP
jgi:DNA helicase-2/ATP-dependent DNA helicase PcrA